MIVILGYLSLLYGVRGSDFPGCFPGLIQSFPDHPVTLSPVAPRLNRTPSVFTRLDKLRQALLIPFDLLLELVIRSSIHLDLKLISSKSKLGPRCNNPF